jgi:polysaccharide biosynthesis transport protein
MSIGLGLGSVRRDAEREPVSPEIRPVLPVRTWNPERFAREQIRSLVRQVFLSNLPRPARQVLFTPAEAETDVRSLCMRVGESLALETMGSIAIVGRHPHLVAAEEICQARMPGIPDDSRGAPLRAAAVRWRSNVWLVPARENDDDNASALSLHKYAAEIRSEFEYAILEGPPAAESSEAVAMAQFADGVVLVLSAHRTRRATAIQIKKMLEESHARLLGTVLTDREFPLPESLYRRL